MNKQIEYLLDRQLIRPSTSPYGEPVLFTPKADAGPTVGLLADQDGRQLDPQDSVLYQIRILRVLGDAVRTLQCTSDVPGGDEPHPMTPVGRVRNGVPRRHTHLLQEHERARGASTESLRDPAGEQVLREAVEEQLRPEEGAVSLAHMVSTCTQLFASSFILIHSFDMVSEQVLLSKGEVPNVLIPSIRAVRLQLNERFSQDLPILRLHSDRGGEFSSDLLRDFFMEVARTSMIHAAAPHFLWPFAVRYAAHQLNLWPRVSLPETLPTLRWTGEAGDASLFRVCGSCAFVRDSSADKLSARAIPCVFSPDALAGSFTTPPRAMSSPLRTSRLTSRFPYTVSSPTALPLPRPRHSSLLPVPLW
ncbi:unnamed protein product [Closterium sp. NIES-54]